MAPTLNGAAGVGAATATEVGQDRFLPPYVYLPVLIVLGYAAFLITGFDHALGHLQALPLYIFFSLALLVFQASLSRTRSPWRLVYIFLTSGFSIVYAGERVFNSAGNFTHSPYTYIIINVLLVIVFLVDAFARFSGKAERNTWQRWIKTPTIRVYATLATNFAGLALLFYISAILLDMLGPQNVLHDLHRHIGQPYAGVDLNSALHLHLSPPLNSLQTVNILFALIATAITFLLFVILGALVVPEVSASSGATEAAAEAQTFGASLVAIVRVTIAQVSQSLRLVLGPLVWLIPAFMMAAFAQSITTYLNFASAFRGATLLDLFNPFSKAGLESAFSGIATVGQGVLAILMVIVSVIVVEQNATVIRRAIHTFAETGRFLLLTWAFFLYSLAAINAAIVLVGPPPHPEPFQVGAPGLLALLGGITIIAYANLSSHAPRGGARLLGQSRHQSATPTHNH